MGTSDYAVVPLNGDISTDPPEREVERLVHGAAEIVCRAFGLGYPRCLSLASGDHDYAPWSELSFDEQRSHLAVLPGAARGEHWGYLKATWPAVP